MVRNLTSRDNLRKNTEENCSKSRVTKLMRSTSVVSKPGGKLRKPWMCTVRKEHRWWKARMHTGKM